MTSDVAYADQACVIGLPLTRAVGKILFDLVAFLTEVAEADIRAGRSIRQNGLFAAVRCNRK